MPCWSVDVIGKRLHLKTLSKDRLLLREWLLRGPMMKASPRLPRYSQLTLLGMSQMYFEAAIAELSPSAKAAAIAAARRLLDQLEADALGRH
jgi:hypothetical protein